MNQDSGPPSGTLPPLKPADIRKAKFRKNLKGYNIQEVDAFLDHFASRVEHGEAITPSVLSNVQFRLSLRGYDVREVDRYLDLIARSNAT